MAIRNGILILIDNHIVRFTSTFASSFDSFKTRLRPLLSQIIFKFRQQGDYNAVEAGFGGDSGQLTAQPLTQVNAPNLLMELDLDTQEHETGQFELAFSNILYPNA